MRRVVLAAVLVALPCLAMAVGPKVFGFAMDEQLALRYCLKYLEDASDETPEPRKPPGPCLATHDTASGYWTGSATIETPPAHLPEWVAYPDRLHVHLFHGRLVQIEVRIEGANAHRAVQSDLLRKYGKPILRQTEATRVRGDRHVLLVLAWKLPEYTVTYIGNATLGKLVIQNDMGYHLTRPRKPKYGQL